LLVQAVDHHVPDVAALIEPFRFIPDWRIDDVMVSYATDGGGVGPHFDQYDVFLVQGLGRRKWQLGAACDATTAMLPNDDLRLLARFEAVEEWILEPGDILYVPPRIAHNGAAVGDDCMTYSIGFRAPSRRELMADWCDHVLVDLQDDDRYTDPGLPAQDNPGEVSAAALDRLHALAIGKLLDRDAFARWFGRYNSARKYPEIEWAPEVPIDPEQLRERMAANLPLSRNPASRFSFIRQPAGPLLLFVDGQCFECTGPTAALAEQLCARERLTIDPALMEARAVVELLVTLCNQGSVAFDEED
jgi:50S ribosomal protein L16 3-hydroxylase